MVYFLLPATSSKFKTWELDWVPLFVFLVRLNARYGLHVRHFGSDRYRHGSQIIPGDVATILSLYLVSG